MAQQFDSVDDYIHSFPPEVQPFFKPRERRSMLRLLA